MKTFELMLLCIEFPHDIEFGAQIRKIYKHQSDDIKSIINLFEDDEKLGANIRYRLSIK